jgi:hypothetical protein
VALFADQFSAYFLQFALAHKAHGLNLLTAANMPGDIRAILASSAATPAVRQ